MRPDRRRKRQSDMTTTISFTDLTHTGSILPANTFPLGISMVAAYAKQELGDEIDFEIFKYPEDFSQYLEKGIPKIAAFSCYSWSFNLCLAFAERIRKASPQTIIIFGGVHFPTELDEQHAFLAENSVIDFFIDGDGELPFVELYNALKACDFDAEALKKSQQEIPSTRYLIDGEMIAGDLMPRISNMDDIPSVYLDGTSDKFFDGILTPMVENARGCPYSCTFCNDGRAYASKTRRFSQERIYAELDYIAQRSTVNEFIITDLNFGIFKEDVETSRYLAKLQDKYDFPKYLVQASAKNNKDRIIEISKIMRGALAPGASVQSTDSDVLKAIKRKNLTVEDLTEVANTRGDDDASGYSEIIMCLPEDTKESHFKSVFDMIGAGMTLLRNHQFMLLEGTEAASRESRKTYEMDTRFRVLALCFGKYQILGEVMPIAEIEEFCITNKTMSYEDYCDCRDLDLSVEIFLNDAIFYDLLQFLEIFGVSRTDFVREVHERAISGETVLTKIYRDYREEEERNHWNSREEAMEFIKQPDVVERYIAGEFGVNEIQKYRTIAVCRHLDVLHEVAFAAARNLLGDEAKDEEVDLYLTELSEFSLMRKSDFWKSDKKFNKTFHFDFMELARNNFTIDPFDVRAPEGVTLEVFHTNRQRDMIDGWIRQYDTSLLGLSRILSRAQFSAMYRNVKDAHNIREFTSKWASEQAV